MKRLAILFTLTVIFVTGYKLAAQAQSGAPKEEASDTTTLGEEEASNSSLHQAIKDKFVEGGGEFMGLVLISLVLGLVIAMERIVALNLAYANGKEMILKVETALVSDGIAGAMAVVEKGKSSIARIFTHGLNRETEGLDVVEKSLIAYGSIEIGRLEKGLVWISLFIALAPMLGFMGTVIGMIQAFDAIEVQNTISAQVVAAGIKVALLTTVAGLIVGVVLQLIYNYLTSVIDAIVNDMEDASTSLVDLLVARKLAQKL